LLLVLLILAIGLDLACVALLAAAAGLVFGSGPESANGDMTAVILWASALAVCVLATAGGYFLSVRGLAYWAVFVALIPPVVGVCFFTV
jgi:hypothetical protein